MLFRLAALNVVRNLRQTVLSMGSVIAGVAVLILGQGFIAGLSENTIRAQVGTLSGHILVRPAGYPNQGLQHPIDELLAVDDALVGHISERSEAWTTRTLFVPRAVAGVNSLGVRAIAFDPARDEQVFPRDTWHIYGKMPETAEDGVLVSKGISRLL
jgi:ABC-type lipoprotein release transport system permease subunit